MTAIGTDAPRSAQPWTSFTAPRGFDDWRQVSDGHWTASDGVQDRGDQLWLGNQTYEALIAQQAAEQPEHRSSEAYGNAWEADDGPVNAEGDTAHDGSLGFTTKDTGPIEPASAAGSMSPQRQHGHQHPGGARRGGTARNPYRPVVDPY